MTDTPLTRASRIALAVVLVASLLAAGPGLVAAAAAETTTDAAEIHVEQPSYVDGDPEERTDDGTPVYIVEGDTQHIYPDGLDAENVTNYGVESSTGALSEDSDLERWTLDPEGTDGSFELYWDVETETTDGNETTTETTRYEAIVQVDSYEAVTVYDSDDAADLEADAAEWREWDATVTEVRESGIIGHAISAPQSNEEVMQSMVNAYLTTRSPTHLLDGGFTAAVIIMTTTLGGIFLFLLLKVPDLFALRSIYEEYLTSKTVRETEGDVSEKQEQVDLESRLQAFANIDWQDIPSVTDHEAAEAREKLGETPLEGLLKLEWLFHPETIKENRVRVMGHSGYVASVETLADDTDDDDDDDDELVIDAARLVHRDDVLEADETVADREDLLEVTEPSETLLEAIPDDDPELVDFPLETAEFDVADLKEPPETLSLSSIVDRLEFSEYAFADDERAGKFVREFVEMVNNHPITTEDGSLDGTRLELERLLQFFQAADDRYQLPLAKWYKQAFTRAIDDYDADDDLHRFLDEHRARTDRTGA